MIKPWLKYYVFIQDILTYRSYNNKVTGYLCVYVCPLNSIKRIN